MMYDEKLKDACTRKITEKCSIDATFQDGMET